MEADRVAANAGPLEFRPGAEIIRYDGCVVNTRVGGVGDGHGTARIFEPVINGGLIRQDGCGIGRRVGSGDS